MKAPWIILSSLYAAASASRSFANVLVYDPASTEPVAQRPPSVSPEVARLILAQRLGVSRYHSIKTAEEKDIENINTYGGKSQRLFGEETLNHAHSLIWIEDVEDCRALIPDAHGLNAQFMIDNIPPSSESQRLIHDIILQAESLPKKLDPMGYTYTSGINMEAELMKLKHVNTYNINNYLNVFYAEKSDNLSVADLSTAIAHIVERANSEETGKHAVTIVLVPSKSRADGPSVHTYGTYDVPSNIQARSEKPELLLSPSAQPTAQIQSPNVSDLEDFPTIMSTTQQANDTSPVLGILPACFLTEDECQSKTHGCSGHGSCLLKHKGEQGKDARVRDCWTCKCADTVVKVGNGNKTTVWGGPACQKKDVSVPFWLFVGSGVMIAFLIGSGIALLYSVGSEELPSVIGAGVSGPVRK